MAEPGYISEASLAALKRLRQRPAPPERCELCALPLEERHAHLFEPKERRILCACEACAFLFQDENAVRYRRVPRDAYVLADFALDDLQWEALSIPISLAFFFHSSTTNRVAAYYPSPAGATESLLNLEAWEEIAGAYPRLREMQPDVEALLVNRLSPEREYYIVPIDRCYELAGIVRKHWQGFTGGDDVWREVDAFFGRLRSESLTVGAARA